MRTRMWYDKRSKNWVVQGLDSMGNQVGNAHYVYTKKEAEKIRKELRGKPAVKGSRKKPSSIIKLW